MLLESLKEFGQVGRDGKSSEAHIFYSDDIHHVGFWNGNLARTNRSEHISDVSNDFSNAHIYIYSACWSMSSKGAFNSLGPIRFLT